MKLSDLGEFSLIERLSSKIKQKLPEGILEIGDDCAVVPVSQDLSWMFPTSYQIYITRNLSKHFLL